MLRAVADHFHHRNCAGYRIAAAAPVSPMPATPLNAALIKSPVADSPKRSINCYERRGAGCTVRARPAPIPQTSEASPTATKNNATAAQEPVRS